MYIENASVKSVQKIGEGTFLMKVLSPSIASIAKPGQFCNIKVSEGNYPLLRRPFSICNVEEDYLFFLFDIHGEGTKILAGKKEGETIEILGPLGKGFVYDGNYDTAIVVAGGLGAAPFPFLTEKLNQEKDIVSLVGGRSKKFVVTHGLKNVAVSTDDGSDGYKGTVVDLLKNKIGELSGRKIRIFACGPNPMLKALQQYTIENNLDCQLSVECAMACGFGICQGCPVDSSDGESYLLVCKDGPVFNADKVKL